MLIYFLNVIFSSYHAHVCFFLCQKPNRSFKRKLYTANTAGISYMLYLPSTFFVKRIWIFTCDCKTKWNFQDYTYLDRPIDNEKPRGHKYVSQIEAFNCSSTFWTGIHVGFGWHPTDMRPTFNNSFLTWTILLCSYYSFKRSTLSNSTSISFPVALFSVCFNSHRCNLFIHEEKKPIQTIL